MHPVIYVADVGSIAHGNFGWARVEADSDGTQVERESAAANIEDLVSAVAHDLMVSRRPVAMGFECPLFVPVPKDPSRLGAARHGEGSRPFSAAAGASAMVTGLVEAAWLLRALRARCHGVSAFVDWHEFNAAGTGLFLWEAFVSGAAKGADHVDDAHIAALAFRDALPDPSNANAVNAEAALSMVGAALLWSEWSCDMALLHEPTLVIKPTVSTRAAERPRAEPRPPAETVSSSRRRTESLREWVGVVAAQIPVGRWTTYGDVARLIQDRAGGMRPVALGVGNELKKNPGITNAHRIINAAGKIPDGYPYALELLEDEGVRFLDDRADPTQRWPHVT